MVTLRPDIKNYRHPCLTAKINVWQSTLNNSVHDFSVMDIDIRWINVWDGDL